VQGTLYFNIIYPEPPMEERMTPSQYCCHREPSDEETHDGNMKHFKLKGSNAFV
jgi:hypothetical protein